MAKRIEGDFVITDLYDLKLEEYEEIEKNYWGEEEYEFTLEEYYEQIVGDLKPDEKFVATRYTGSAEEVTIPDSVVGVGERLFFQNKTLRKVNIPDSVNRVYDFAFFECFALEEVNFGSNVAEVGIYAFCGCTSLKRISFPKSMRNLGESMLKDCSALEEICFNDGLKTIAKQLMGFKNNSLKKIVIPDSVEVIDWQAFYGCSALEEVVFGKNLRVIEVSAFCECSSLQEVSLPESLEEIGLSAFSKCNLKGVYIPKNVKGIGWKAFENNRRFKKIEISPDNPYLYVRNNCIFDKGDDILLGAVGKYEIPNDGSVKIIARSAFHQDRSIVDLQLPEGLEVIEDAVFDECVNLRSVRFPSSLTKIGAAVFGDCSALTEITVLGNVRSIGGHAFFRSGLTKAVLKRGVTVLGDYAFRSCKSLREVFIPSTVILEEDAAPFYECDKSLKIYVEKSGEERQNKLMKALKKYNVEFITESDIFD